MISVPKLHLIANRRVFTRPDFDDILTGLARVDSVALHLRDHDVDGRALAEVASRAGATGVRCIVNDRADVAIAADADGVHLPSHGLPVEPTRRLMADRLVGRSTHTPEEITAARRDGADYVFYGPVWPTPSHPHHPGVGLDGLAADHPHIIAIGGVTADRVGPCVAAGAFGVAVIRAVWDEPDPADAAAHLRLLLGT